MGNTTRRVLKLRNYIPYRLSVAANTVSRLIALAYEQRFGLTIPQWRLIAVLAEQSPLTPQQLCGMTIMDKVTVTRAASGLLRRRLIRRTPHESDARSHRLALTAAGETLYEDVAPLALDYEAKLLEGLDERDIEKLEQQLQLLEQTAAALTKD